MIKLTSLMVEVPICAMVCAVVDYFDLPILAVILTGSVIIIAGIVIRKRK